jgi:hypothetical protein
VTDLQKITTNKAIRATEVGGIEKEQHYNKAT